MSDDILVNKVPYYLPLTRIRVHGTRTTKTSITGKAVTTYAIKVDLITTADPDHPRYIVEADSLLADRQLTVESTEKGLLSGTDATSTGKLGSIITNVFGAVLRFGLFFAAPGLPFAAAAGGPPTRGTAETIEEKYEKAFPGLNAARKAAKQAVADLIKAIADSSRALVAIADPAEVKKQRTRIQELKEALEDVRRIAKELEDHFSAWIASGTTTEATERDYTTELDKLPAEKDIHGLRDKTEAEIRAALKQLPETLSNTFWDLRFVVADTKDFPDPKSKLPMEGNNGDKPPLGNRGSARGVEFRLPRPTILSLFEIREQSASPPTPGNPTPTRYDLVLKERREVSISDSKCATAILIIKGSAWSESSLDIDFSTSGSVKKIATNSKSELAAVADALSKLPDEAVKALKDANVAVDERQKLALQGIEHRIDELKKQKEETQARIALGETLATEEQSAELKRLDQEISLLQKQVQLSQLSGTQAADVQLKLIEIEEQLVKARAALESAEIERLKVQAELKKVQAPGPQP